MEPARIAIVGAGVIGKTHAKFASQSPDVQLVAMCDVDAGKRKAVAEEFNIPRQYESLDKLFHDKDIEGVILALPTGVRTPLAIEVLKHGRHLLLEKPAARSVEELYSIMKAQGDRVVGCCSARFAFQESAKVAREIVASGRLGRIRIVRIRGLGAAGERRKADNPPPVWRVSRTLNGGGILANWGVYDLDYMLNICGWKITPHAVLAQVYPVAPHLLEGRVDPTSDAETHAVATIVCQGGETIHMERGEFLSQSGETAWQIVGEKGTLHLKMVEWENPSVTLEMTDPATGVTEKQVLLESQESIQHMMPVVNFARAIRGAEPIMTPLKHAMVIQQIVDAIYESSQTRQCAMLP